MGAKDRRRWPRYGRGRAAKVAGGGGAATKEEPSPAEAALAGGPPKEFGPSQATVQVSGRAQVDAASQQLFGRQLSNEELGVPHRCAGGLQCRGVSPRWAHGVLGHPSKHRSCQPVPLPEREGQLRITTTSSQPR